MAKALCVILAVALAIGQGHAGSTSITIARATTTLYPTTPNETSLSLVVAAAKNAAETEAAAKAVTEKEAAENDAAEKNIAETAATEKMAADMKFATKAAAEKEAAEKAAADKAAAAKTALKKIAAEKAPADNAKDKNAHDEHFDKAGWKLAKLQEEKMKRCWRRGRRIEPRKFRSSWPAVYEAIEMMMVKVTEVLTMLVKAVGQSMQSVDSVPEAKEDRNAQSTEDAPNERDAQIVIVFSSGDSICVWRPTDVKQGQRNYRACLQLLAGMKSDSASAASGPQEVRRFFLNSTAADLLRQQEAARDRAASIACPKMSAIVAFDEHLSGCKDRIGEAQVRIASAGSVAMYDVAATLELSKGFETASKNFGESMRRSLEMCAPTPESQSETRLPFLECHLRESLTPGVAPVGFVEHYTYVKEKNRRGEIDEWYEKDLYVFWRGSQDFMDWACDANASLTPSQDGDVMIHGGMCSRFNEFKIDLEEVILNFLNDDTAKYGKAVQPRRIYFAGHSLGAGLAMLTHFQLYAAQEDHHWPYSKQIREFAKESSNGVFMIGFAGPPVFHVKKDAGAPTGCVKQVSERGINFTMEYDVVPRLMNVQYCKDVVKSCVEGKINAEVDSPLVKVFVNAVKKNPLSNLEEMLERNAALMSSLQHLHPMFVQYVEKTDSTWQWTVLDHGSFDAYSNFDWPFKSGSPMATLMPVNDHSVLPGKLDKTWRDDTCSVCGEVPEDDTAKWKDCSHCQATFCDQCFEKEHRDPLKGEKGEIVSWHVQDERSLDDKKSMRVVFTMVGVKAARFLNDMRYNTMLIRMAADVFKPTNIWLVADFCRETGKIGQLATQIGQAGSSFALAGQAVSKVVGPAECIFVTAMAVCETGWLCYKRWSCNELDCAQFWMKLGACWASAAGTIGGMFGGAFVGGLIGSVFGPVGTVVGAVIGSAVGGAIGGAAARYGTEELITWAAGLNPEEKEKVNWGIISRAMHIMGFGTETLPSALTAQQTRSAQRRQALMHHPDKTGLMGKARLTKAEEETLLSSAKKFHEIQSHFDTLSAFVDARDQEGSAWTPEVLRKLDRFYIELLGKFDKIDEKADKLKEEVAKGIATSKGGYIGNEEAKP